MSMRVSRLITHLRVEEALALIDFLGQVRGMLRQHYGEEIRAMLHEESLAVGWDRDDSTEVWIDEDELPF